SFNDYAAGLGLRDSLLVAHPLVHMPVFFSPAMTDFSFTYYVLSASPNDTLTVAFQTDDGQSIPFPGAARVPAMAGGGQVTVNAVSFPSFAQLAGKMVKISFALNV